MTFIGVFMMLSMVRSCVWVQIFSGVGLLCQRTVEAACSLAYGVFEVRMDFQVKVTWVSFHGQVQYDLQKTES